MRLSNYSTASLINCCGPRRRCSVATPRDNSEIFFYGCLSGRPSLLAAPRIPRLATGYWPDIRPATPADLPRRRAPAAPRAPATHASFQAPPGPSSPARSPRTLRLAASIAQGHDYIWKPRYR